MSDESSRERAIAEIKSVYEHRLQRREEIDARDAGRVRRTDVLRWRDYRRALQAVGLDPIGPRDVLDVGCQWGTWLALCRTQWGQTDGRLCGVELMEAWVEKAHRLHPFLEVSPGSADRLPWPDNSFDLAHQGMVFSSVLDERLRDGIAAEISRVVRPGGYFLWYDFFFNPGNSQTLAMTVPRIKAHFPGWNVQYRRRITLVPPLARLLDRICPPAIDAITALRLLNFHYLMILKKA